MSMDHVFIFKIRFVTNAVVVALIGRESRHPAQQKSVCAGPLVTKRCAREDGWRPLCRMKSEVR